MNAFSSELATFPYVQSACQAYPCNFLSNGSAHPLERIVDLDASRVVVHQEADDRRLAGGKLPPFGNESGADASVLSE